MSGNFSTLDIDYAEKYGIKEIQEKLKLILLKIDEVCRRYNIEYSIAYGTQIGAVRHGGFIPWDDDADIIMTRTNYNKFKKAILNSEELEIIYYLWVERVIYKDFNDKNLFVDIMIFDNYPDSRIKASVKALLSRICQGMLHEKIIWDNYKGILKLALFVTRVLGKMIGSKKSLLLYNKIQQIGNKKEAKQLASYNSGYADVKIPFEKELFFEYDDIKFEGILLRTNKNWNEVLTKYYGNYMDLPPEEKRVPEHGRLI